MESKVGIIGGAFDPIHIGHLIISELLIDNLGLNQVIFIPSKNPPHKRPGLPYKLRYRMAVLGTEDNPRFEVSDIEQRIGGVSYTIRVVEKLRESLKADFSLIIGADQYEEIETWYKPDELLEHVKVVVVPRPGFQIKKNLPFRDEITVAETPLIDLSSTMIRERVHVGKSIRYLVPDRVAEFIANERLYR